MELAFACLCLVQADPSGTATLSGTVRLGHRAPPRRVFPVDADPRAALHWPEGQRKGAHAHSA